MLHSGTRAVEDCRRNQLCDRLRFVPRYRPLDRSSGRASPDSDRLLFESVERPRQALHRFGFAARWSSRSAIVANGVDSSCSVPALSVVKPHKAFGAGGSLSHHRRRFLRQRRSDSITTTRHDVRRCQVVRAIRRQALNRLVTTDGPFGRDLTLRQRTPSSPRRCPIPASAGASPCDSWVPRAHGGRAETGCRPY